MAHECLLTLLCGLLLLLSHPPQAQETEEFLDPAPATNQGPRRRGRWAQPGVELSVRSMLDLRQLETLAPGPRGPHQDSLAMTPSGPGKHSSQAPATSSVSKVSPLSPSSLEISRLAQPALGRQQCLSTHPAVGPLPPWGMGNLTCRVGGLVRLCLTFPLGWKSKGSPLSWVGFPGGLMI